MSLKYYLVSLLFAVCGFVLLHYKCENLPLPIVGYQLATGWAFPPHCMLFTVALAVNWLNVETEFEPDIVCSDLQGVYCCSRLLIRVSSHLFYRHNAGVDDIHAVKSSTLDSTWMEMKTYRFGQQHQGGYRIGYSRRGSNRVYTLLYSLNTTIMCYNKALKQKDYTSILTDGSNIVRI